MSMARFLTDIVDIEAPDRVSGDLLPTGEHMATEPTVSTAVPCRIRNASASGLAVASQTNSSEVAATEQYTAEFGIDCPTLPTTNDRLVRRSDGAVFMVTGWPDLHGEPRHAMAHYAVPVKRI